MVRLPDGMREKIKAAAAAKDRTMNAEIVSRLKDSFKMDEQRQNDNGRLSFVGAAKRASRSTQPDEELSERVARLEDAINSLEPLELFDDETGRRMLVLGKPITEAED